MLREPSALFIRPADQTTPVTHGYPAARLLGDSQPPGRHGTRHDTGSALALIQKHRQDQTSEPTPERGAPLLCATACQIRRAAPGEIRAEITHYDYRRHSLGARILLLGAFHRSVVPALHMNNECCFSSPHSAWNELTGVSPANTLLYNDNIFTYSGVACLNLSIPDQNVCY